MKKRILNLLLAFFLIAAIVSGAAMPVSALTQSNVESWMNARIGKSLDYDGSYGAQCVDVFNYYLHDLFGISNPIGMYPVQYAYQIYDYNAPAGWSKLGPGNYQVGDIVIWNKGNGSTTGHVGIVYSVNGGVVQIFQQRYNGSEKVTVNTIHYTNLIRGVFRPPLQSETINYANISLGKYFIRNNGTGTYLCISESGNGSNVMVWNRGSNTYEFEMELLSAGTGYRISPTCSDKLLNVDSNAVANGNNVNIFRDGNNSTQWWRFQPVNGGYVIRNVQNSSVCLSIDSNGYNVYVTTYTGAANQIWSLEPTTIAVTGVSLNRSDMTLEVGRSATLQAVVAPNNATNKAVTWSSNNTATAVVDSTGKVTAVAPGSAVITVRTADGSKTASCTVKVPASSFSDIAVTGVSLNRSDMTLEVGRSATLQAVVAPNNATNKAVTWSSNNTATAVVDSTGKVTAVAPGSAVITVRTADGSKTASCTVKVPASSFSDVPAGTWYSDAVSWAVGNGITNGMSNNLFKPDDPCTRGQVITLLWRTFGKPEPNLAQNPFSDISPTDYYYKAVLWGVENGITDGTGNGRFSPNINCTRAHVVTFLWRTEGKPIISGAPSFSDVPAGTWYSDAVSWAVVNGITDGTGNGRFSPNLNCTRAQTVTFLYRDRT